MWTPERVDLVRALAANKLSASQIASELGDVGRNSVIGICFRQKIALLGNDTVKKKYASTPLPAPPPRWFIPKPPLPEPEESPVVDIADMRMLTFDELQPGDCRFPIGWSDYRFCGLQAIEGKPYCWQHARICFKPPEERRR